MFSSCRVRKGTGSQVGVILNKEARDDSSFTWVCEAVVEASGYYVSEVHSVPAL